jgi:hypothetical protein
MERRPQLPESLSERMCCSVIRCRLFELDASGSGKRFREFHPETYHGIVYLSLARKKTYQDEYSLDRTESRPRGARVLLEKILVPVLRKRLYGKPDCNESLMVRN